MPIALVQSVLKHGFANPAAWSLPAPPTPGNLIIFGTLTRGAALGAGIPAGAAFISDQVIAASIGASRVGIAWMVSDGTNSFDFALPSSNPFYVSISEWAGLTGPDGLPVTYTNQAASPSPSMAGLSPTPAASALLLAHFGTAYADGSPKTYDTPAPWVELADAMSDGAASRPHGLFAYRIAAPAAGPHSLTVTSVPAPPSSVAWGGVFAAFAAAPSPTGFDPRHW